MGIQIKKFQAPTLQQAIEQIRSQMGDNAIILQTEPIKEGGLLGRNTIEVTAAIDRAELAPRFQASQAASPTLEKKKTWREKYLPFSAKSRSRVFTAVSDEAPKPASQQAKGETAAAVRRFAEKVAGQNSDAPSMGQLYAVKTFIEPLQKELESLKAQLKPERPLPQARRMVRDPLESEIQELRAELGRFITEKRFESSHLPTYFKRLQEFWTKRGMSNTQVLNFFKAIVDWGWDFDEKSPEDDVASAVTTALEGNISEADVLAQTQKRIVVLIGPTGVGKTTTLAKLAAHEKLKLKKKVALITADDFKIGATDQVAHYARILDVPFFKSRTDMALEEQCRVIEADTIFIDTFGASAFDVKRLQALKKLIEFKDDELRNRLEIHLVLPVGISTADVETALQKFNDFQPRFLIFTKWDETENWGGMLSAILAAKKPVSFVCHGQDVPDDMSVFSKKTFIETVTGIG